MEKTKIDKDKIKELIKSKQNKVNSKEVIKK